MKNSKSELMKGQNIPVFFFGKVVEVEGDELQLGRVKVRIVNHNDNGPKAPEDADLQWCTVIGSIHSTSQMGFGVSPTQLRIGSSVFGMYLDGELKNLPIITGTMYHIPEMDINKHGVSPLARGENNIIKEPVGPEPASPYEAKYPFNHTFTTPGGHAVEFDDTEGKERIHVYHKSGSYFEIHPDGTIVKKSMANEIEVIVTNSTVYVGGDSNVEVVGNAAVKIGGNQTIEVGGDVNITAGGNFKVSASRIDLN